MINVADVDVRHELIRAHYQEHGCPLEKLDLINKYSNTNQPLKYVKGCID
jgi:hypothetical protein